jgi:hypothetical protein
MKGCGLSCGEKTSVSGLLQSLPLSFVPPPKLLDFFVSCSLVTLVRSLVDLAAQIRPRIVICWSHSDG